MPNILIPVKEKRRSINNNTMATFMSFGMESRKALKSLFRPFRKRSSRKSRAIRKRRIALMAEPRLYLDRFKFLFMGVKDPTPKNDI